MADETILQLAEMVAPRADAASTVQHTSDATRSEHVAHTTLGVLHDLVAGDANLSMVPGSLNRADISAWTVNRTFTLPALANVGARVCVYITDGHASVGPAIRNAAGQTIDGTDYSAADWGLLRLTGQLVVFRCVVANTTWVTEIFEQGLDALYPPSRIDAGSTVNLTLDPNGSPRVVLSNTGASITVNAPTSGDGDLAVVIVSAIPTVSLVGFTEEAGTDPGTAMRTAYVTRISTGETKWAWGP